MTHSSSPPASYWIGQTALGLTVIAMFLPWGERTIEIAGIVISRSTISGMDHLGGFVALLTFGVTLAGSVLLAIIVGYQTIIELLLSRPAREIANFRAHILLAAAWIVGVGLFGLFSANGGGAGAWLATVSGVVLAGSCRNEYQRAG